MNSMTQDHPMKTSSLNTADQNEVERMAVRLMQSSEVMHQKEWSRRQLQADPVASTPDGARTLEGALENLTYAAALGGANGDPSRPKVTWTLAAPRDAFGHSVPGSRYLIDNPDTVYRFITVDGSSHYEITVRPKQPGPAQYSFMLHDTMFSENTKKDLANLDQPIAGLRDLDIKTNPDGSFKLTVDSDPPGGRANHLQSDPNARIIWVRNSLDRWGVQYPHDVTVKRVGGPSAPHPMTEGDMAQLAAAILKGGTEWLLALMNRTFAHVAQPNIVSKVFGRGGAWGYAARGNFRLTDEEGLLIELAPTVPDRYVGFQLTDPWQVSCEYIMANGSLNNAQAVPNPDGGYTFVISVRDPGINNWLDTGGLHEGGFLIRWQALPETPVSLENAVRPARIVNIKELPALVPAGTPNVSANQRQTNCRQRVQLYSHRHLG
jgi:hypothetical protein